MREGTQNMTEEDIQMKKIVFFGGGPIAPSARFWISMPPPGMC